MPHKDASAEIAVSRETSEAFRRYEALLRKWQKAINLVGPATLADVYTRHIQDSLQILPHIGPAKIIYDLGSGAGFPGMVLAMARPDLAVHLIESDSKKCAFLRTVSRETSTAVQIEQGRIEALSPTVPPDLVTARALAPLRALCDYIAPFSAQNPALRALFLKGAGLEDELAACREAYSFDLQTYPSLTEEGAWLVEIGNLAPKL